MFPHTQGSAKTRQGFTLIELLVVIAIIAILAALLFPVYAEARNRARLAACISNMKQIGAAAHMYMQDHDDTFPECFGLVGHWDNHSIGGKQGMAPGSPGLPAGAGCAVPPEQRPLNRYTKTLKIWQCPREKIQTGCPRPDYDVEGTSYVANGVWFWNGVWDRSMFRRKLSEVKYPSAQVIIGERGIQDFYNNVVGGRGYRNHDRSKPKCVAAFADGHAAYIEMTYGCWDGSQSGRPMGTAKWIMASPSWRPAWNN